WTPPRSPYFTISKFKYKTRSFKSGIRNPSSLRQVAEHVRQRDEQGQGVEQGGAGADGEHQQDGQEDADHLALVDGAAAIDPRGVAQRGDQGVLLAAGGQDPAQQ